MSTAADKSASGAIDVDAVPGSMAEPTPAPASPASPDSPEFQDAMGEIDIEDEGESDPTAAEDEASNPTPQLSSAEAAQVRNIGTMTIPEIEAYDDRVKRGVGLFFDNKFQAAEDLMGEAAHEDALHALGASIFKLLKAVTTFDPEHLAVASAAMARAEALANEQFKSAAAAAQGQNGGWRVARWIKGGASFIAQTAGLSGPPMLQPAQLRATVIRAETGLLLSMLLLFQESMVAFVKAGLGLRKAHRSYVVAWHNHEQYRKDKEGNRVPQFFDTHTLSGLYFGIGALNMSLSILPSKILRLVSIFGYKGDREHGLDLLTKAAEGRGLRGPLAALFLGGYNSLLAMFEPRMLGPRMYPIAGRHLSAALKEHPNSAFHLLLASVVLRGIGAHERSRATLERALRVQDEWQELKLLMHFELGLSASMRLDWPEAAKRFEILRIPGYWSAAFLTFAEAAARWHSGEFDRARDLCASVPALVTRKFGGRHIGIEQYVISKCETYKTRDNHNMVLPLYEILYIWNAFQVLGRKTQEEMVSQIDKQLADPTLEGDEDAHTVLYALKSSLAGALGDYTMAEEAYDLAMQQAPRADTWAQPMATYQRGVMEVYRAVHEGKCGAELQEALRSAKEWLQKAQRASGYNFEYRVAFRTHLVLAQIEEWLKVGQEITADMLRLPTEEQIFEGATRDFTTSPPVSPTVATATS